MSRYASQTSVSSEKSRAEIEATLRRYHASPMIERAYTTGATPLLLGNF